MKNLILIILLSLGISLSSCSEDSKSSEPIGGEQFEIGYLTFMSDGDSFASITYSGVIMSLFEDNGASYTFNYNSDNMILKAIEQQGEELIFFYEGGRLDKIEHTFTDGTQSWFDQFNYNSNNKIISIIENDDDGYDESRYFTYDSSGVLESSQTGVSGPIYTYEFDDKKNPFYEIWNDFSFLIDLEDHVYDIIPMFAKHNPILVHRNGEEILRASYTYNKEDYSLNSSYTRSNGSGTINYQYQ